MSWESMGIDLLSASLMRPFALAAVAWLVLWVFRVRHPASRHAVWTAVLVGMLVLPFVSVLTPHWKLNVMPAKRVSATTAIAPTPVAFDPVEWNAPQAAASTAEAHGFEWPTVQKMIIWFYFAGFFAMVSYRVVGRLLLWRVMSRSAPTRSRFLLESGDVLTPVAVGVLRPVVILPSGWREWNAVTRRAVLAHEFAHLRRHDAWSSALGRWVRCLLWFHPLAWWVSRNVSDLAELACDAIALERASDPAGYSRMLLGFADVVNRAGNRVALPGLAITSGSRMDRRIEQVFELSGGAARKLTRPVLVLGIIGVPLICLAATAGLGERVNLLPRNSAVLRSMAPVIVAQQSAAYPVAAPMSVPVATQAVTQAKAAARPEFEVASIKLSAGCTPVGGGRGGRGGGLVSSAVNSSPGRLNVGCQSVIQLIQMAYDKYANGAFRSGRLVPIEGAPAWTQSDRYTIEAKGDAGQKEGVMRGPMMQALLEDRFQLKIRRETREVPVYELTVANGGAKLEPFHEGSCDATEVAVAERDPGVNYCNTVTESISRSSPNHTVHRQRMTLDDFARTIDADRPVINKTGITGLFNFSLEYAPESNSDAAILQRAEAAATPAQREQMLAMVAARADGPPAISIFTAVEKQLGLKLEKATGPGEVLVIDSVQRPSEN